LRDLMARSEAVLAEHPANEARRVRGEMPAAMVWLFWGSGPMPDMPAFGRLHGLKAAMTSGVDLLNGLARLAGMDVLSIAGVTDNVENDYRAQAAGALEALEQYDLVVVHIEAPDEAAHDRAIDTKVGALQLIDREIIGRLRTWPGDIRLLVMPDHHTPIAVQTHTADPVPFLLWGARSEPNGAGGFTEAEAEKTGLFLEDGHKMVARLTGK
jgi:2,3-bisphosphoglycerate-independent phosphoglycerate mutase